MAYWGKQKAGPCAKQRYEAYKEGRTDEAERGQRFIGTLKEVLHYAGGSSRDDYYVEIPWSLVADIEKLLNEYNQP
jgi:hypothetical protein